MRIGRWVLGIAAGCVLLIVIAVLVVTLFVDPNRFRGQIEAAVTRATGQPFRIEGDLEISWYPWLGLRMGAAEFGKAPQGTEPPILSWQSARVGAKLIPLTQGQLIISRIRLDSPHVWLRRDAQGHGNWDEVSAALKASAKAPQPAGPNNVPGPQIAGFEVRDGTLDFIDAGSPEGAKPARPTHLHISHWQLDVGQWREGATFPVETQFSWKAAPPAQKKKRGGARIPYEVELRAAARVHVSDDANDIDLFGLESTGLVKGGLLAAQGLPVSVAVSRMAARLSPLDIGISEVSARIGAARLTAAIQAGQTGPEKALYVRGPLSLQVPSVRTFLPEIGVQAPLPLDKGTIGAMSLSSMWEWNDGAVTVNGIDLRLDETHFNGELTRAKGEDPLWTFALHGDKIGLSRYVAIQQRSQEPFELPVAALRALKVQGELTFDQAWLAQAQMKNVRMKFEMADGAVKSVP